MLQGADMLARAKQFAAEDKRIERERKAIAREVCSPNHLICVSAVPVFDRIQSIMVAFYLPPYPYVLDTLVCPRVPFLMPLEPPPTGTCMLTPLLTTASSAIHGVQQAGATGNQLLTVHRLCAMKWDSVPSLDPLLLHRVLIPTLLLCVAAVTAAQEGRDAA